MRYPTIKRAAALIILIAVAGIVTFGRVDNNNPPTEAQKEFAVQTADLLQAEIFAALLQEFGETTPENVEQGKQAISLVFHDANRDIRLIGTFDPLGGNNNLPSDPFEQQSFARSLQGEGNTAVERHGNRWYYRRSIALSNSFHTSCAMCHSNFTPQFFADNNNPGQWVGALTLRVPIKQD